MTPDQLAALHARCFTLPRPWSAPAFAALLDSPHVFLLARPDGFLLGRTVADEAELLTLAVSPDARRQGIARDLVAEFAATSRARGATRAFLEVAADNAPAQALYAATGWRETGRRRRYYGPDLDAIVMELPLEDRQEGG
ncbi:ribosomal protein S18-alanine N-acetyltransferase [Paracoccus shandongensis]|uniref:ribosomal protein S18-alanine N-acetyltransferase n=1 Tax=Paracoccus shandongensis TaxID=2816048 RepID=UPI001A90C8C8